MVVAETTYVRAPAIVHRLERSGIHAELRPAEAGGAHPGPAGSWMGTRRHEAGAAWVVVREPDVAAARRALDR